MSTRTDAKPLWTDIVQTVAVPLSILAASWFGLQQLGGVERQLKSAAASAVFDQQLDINNLFLSESGTDLVPYFFDDKALPNGSTDIAIRAIVTAGSILDFFSHVEDQAEAESFAIDAGWRSYLEQSFERSPILCQTLYENLPAYGGEESGLIEFATGRCAQFPAR